MLPRWGGVTAITVPTLELVRQPTFALCRPPGAIGSYGLRVRPCAISAGVRALEMARDGAGARSRKQQLRLGCRPTPGADRQNFEDANLGAERHGQDVAGLHRRARLIDLRPIEANLAPGNESLGQCPRFGYPCKPKPLIDALNRASASHQVEPEPSLRFSIMAFKAARAANGELESPPADFGGAAVIICGERRCSSRRRPSPCRLSLGRLSPAGCRARGAAGSRRLSSVPGLHDLRHGDCRSAAVRSDLSGHRAGCDCHALRRPPALPRAVLLSPRQEQEPVVPHEACDDGGRRGRCRGARTSRRSLR